MAIWRIHIKTDYNNEFTRKDLLNFCIKEQIVGVGWMDISTRVNDESEIRKQASSYENATAAIKALNAMRRMKIGDLVWTRLDSIYYLCRVKDVWENSRPTELHKQFDMTNFVSAEWVKIGPEQDVPGKVVSSFRPSATVQAVRNVDEITKYIWNKNAITNQYEIKKQNIDFWNVLSEESIEELFLLYLQIEKGYHIYSSTVKYAFPLYECQLVNADGKHAYPQVKSGNESLNADDYMSAFEYDSMSDVFLFAVSENYKKNNDSRVHYATKKEMEDFIFRHREVIPKLTNMWIELCTALKNQQQ